MNKEIKKKEKESWFHFCSVTEVGTKNLFSKNLPVRVVDPYKGLCKANQLGILIVSFRYL